MPELSRYLFLAGSLPFIVLGAAHALATPRAPGERRGLSPSDPQLGVSMRRTTLRLTRNTDMWLAWVGFNLSHSLGALAFGAAVLLVGRSAASYAASGAVFLPFAALVSGSYLVLGVRYWFRVPIAGCALSFALFLAAWLLG